MIITIVLAVLTIAGIVVTIINSKRLNDGLALLGIEMVAIFGIGLFACVMMIIVNNSAYDLKKIKLEAKREAIVYQIENNMYYGDSLGEFNVELKKKQILHDSPWTSWLIGDYVMEIEPIDLEK